MDEVLHGDALEVLDKFEPDSVDLCATDAPYGLRFMAKHWDVDVPSVELWKKVLRVLKPGAFLFNLSSPRQDVLARNIMRINEAGFDTNFTSLYWTYSQGFPKGMNLSKAVDRSLGAERKIIGRYKDPSTGKEYFPTKDRTNPNPMAWEVKGEDRFQITEPASEQAKILDGSYAGYQPKPAVEVVIVGMKPLAERGFLEQALKNRKGITWLEDGRIPYSDQQDKDLAKPFGQPTSKIGGHLGLPNVEGLPRQEFDFENWGRGRYAPNLLVQDDVLAIETGSGHLPAFRSGGYFGKYWKDSEQEQEYFGPGHFSRYFDLDAWFRKKLDSLPSEVRKTFPFLVVSKASSAEKNEGLEGQPLGEPPETARSKPAPGRQNALGNPRENFHPTVKPVALMSYLITIGSRENDVVLDPLCGSGSTLIAARLLARRFYGIDKDADSVRIARGRLQEHLAQERLENWFE